MVERAHALLSASAMDRWSQCPGSPRLNEHLENIENEYSIEGTHAHDLAAFWLTMDIEPKFPDTQAGLEMRNAVSDYVTVCNKYRHPVAMEMGAQWGVEHKFDLSKVYKGCFGTCDYWAYWPWLKKLIILDYKHGAGIFVPVVNNLQAQYYALGAVITLGFPVETIEMGIVQPRCQGMDETFRTWEISSLDLMDFQSDLVTFAKATEDPNAPLVPGEHCRYCPANQHLVCPEVKANSYAQIEKQIQVLKPGYDPVKLQEALRMRPVLKAYLKALDEFAYRELIKGARIPGYKIVDKFPQRSFTDLTAVTNMLKAAGYKDADIYEAQTLKSPAQMEKALGKDIVKGLVSAFIASISNGHTVVGDDDKRPSTRLTAEQVFFPIPIDPWS